MTRPRGTLRHVAVVVLRVSSFLEMLAQASIAPLTLSRSSRSRPSWLVYCEIPGMMISEAERCRGDNWLQWDDGYLYALSTECNFADVGHTCTFRLRLSGNARHGLLTTSFMRQRHGLTSSVRTFEQCFIWIWLPIRDKSCRFELVVTTIDN